jgi:hypothetical protein
MLSRLLQAILNILNHSHDAGTGKKGFANISGTGSATGPFYAILAVGGAVVIDLTGTVCAEGSQITDNHTVLEGFTLYGNFTSVKLVSGNAYCYYD